MVASLSRHQIVRNVQGSAEACALTSRRSHPLPNGEKTMKFRRHARVWHLLGAATFAGISLWGWGPTSLAGRQATPRTPAAAATFGQWSFIGPPNYLNSAFAGSIWAGRVTSVAVSPADANHWLIGAAQGGVWESRDAGSTWQPRSDGQPSLAIGAIAFSPGSPNVVYAGTGEAKFTGWTYAGAGMLRSEDSGATWSAVNTTNFARAAVRAILVHATDHNIVVAGTARGAGGRDLDFVTSAPAFGVQRSIDGGRTWSLLLRGEVSDLVRHPADFSRQYVAIGTPTNLSPIAANAIPAPMPNGLYRTGDTGDHWTPVSGPWTSLAGGSGYIALAVAPSNPDVMYASVQSPCCSGPQYLLGLFRTNNAWAATPEWIEIPVDGVKEPGNPQPGYCYGPQSCAYHNVVSVDPTDAETVFAGGRNLWRCASCATRPTWSQVAHTIVRFGDPQNVHADHQALTWVGNRLIDANDGGVWSSIDRGATWRNHNKGLSLFQMYSGAVHPTGDLILANTQDAALAIKRTSAGEWEAAAGLEGNVIMSSTRPDTDWAGTSTNRAVTRTTDGGRSFQVLQAGLDLTGAHFLMPLEKCPASDDVVLVGTNRLWRTNDFFTAASPGWAVNADAGRILSIAFAGSDSSCGTYAFGTVGAGNVSVGFGATGAGLLRITRNGGASWSDFDPSDAVPNRAVTGIAFSASDPNVAYVTLSGLDEGTPGKPGHVFKTANALGESPSWINVTPPVNVPFNVVAIDPATPQTVFVGADNGVWASSDGGGTWAYMGPNAGLPNVAVFDLQIQASTRKVFAFTFGRGAFVLTPSP
jgi:hypothetical protein